MNNSTTNISLRFFFLIILFATNISFFYSQTCLTTGIVFSTQQQIDDFATNYPGCSEILGDVQIQESQSGGITDLSGLAQVTDIGGYLLIGNNGALTSLTGLGNLTAVGGYLSIQYTKLTSLAGLDNLETIGQYLQIVHNTDIININALSKLNAVGSHLQIHSNFSLVDLSGLESLTSIPSYCNIANHTNMTSLKGLDNITSIGGYFYLFSNVALTDLSALNKLTSISGYLHIGVNLALSDLSGLDNLSSIGGFLKINGNTTLVSLRALSSLTSIGGTLEIDNNDSLVDLDGLHNILKTGISNLILTNSSSLATCEMANLCDYLKDGGTATISDNADGCNSLTQVKDDNCDYDSGWTGNAGNNNWGSGGNWSRGSIPDIDEIIRLAKERLARILAAYNARVKRLRIKNGARLRFGQGSTLTTAAGEGVRMTDAASEISGRGTIIGRLDHEGGRVAPGDSPGRFTVSGDYVITAGTLEIEIGGTTPDTEHDQLVITGNASLGGTMEVVLINGYVPNTLPQTFDVVTYASHTGSFNVQLPSTPGIIWKATHFNNKVTITASAPGPFITTWKTDNPGTSCSTCITIPTTGGGYNYDVDWNNDGTFDEFGITGDVTHDFGIVGTYTIRIQGDFPRIYFNNSGDKEKILSIDQWGNIAWKNMYSAFSGACNLIYNAVDAPDLSGVFNLGHMFAQASLFNGDLSNWDVSNVVFMHGMFYRANAFNGDISTWNVSKAGWMQGMFNSANSFNRNLNNWNVSNVINMYSMFYENTAFNGNLDNWVIGPNVTTLNGMFFGASSFNGDISSWDVSHVETMGNMFYGASSFNGDISSWDVSHVETMGSMFYGASSFNGDISSWDVDNVSDFHQMFVGAAAFNQNLGGWNTTTANSMEGMFKGAASFNQDLGGWDISSVTNMQNMLDNSGLSVDNFDNTLIGWESQGISGLTLGANGLKYCAGEPARTSLTITHGWTISGDSKDCSSLYTLIPDPNFEQALIDQLIDSEGILDGKILTADAEAQTTLYVAAYNIADMTGIEAFINLTSLDCGQNQITVLDVSNLTDLITLECGINLLSSLDVEQNTALEQLSCSENQLTALDVTFNEALTRLNCSDNQISSLTGLGSSGMTLTELHCQVNPLGNLVVSQNKALEYLTCSSCQLGSLDVLDNKALISLDCSDNTIDNLSLINNTALIYLFCRSNQLTNLEVKDNKNLQILQFDNNQLTSIGLLQNTALFELSVSYNPLTSLDVSAAGTTLEYLFCSSTDLMDLDLSDNPGLLYLECYGNQLLENMDVRNGNNTQIPDPDFYVQSNPNLTCISVDDPAWSTANWTNIDPGTVFMASCDIEVCDGIDNNGDGQIDEGFDDTDGDNVADCVDPDDDNDGVADVDDNCPLVANPGQADTDADSMGDACDSDDDDDGVADVDDNCPLVANADQGDIDDDTIGDVCDTSTDPAQVLTTTSTYIDDLSVSNGLKNAFNGKFEDALDFYCDGKVQQALQKLNALITQVTNHPQLSPQEENDLIAYANVLIAAINAGEIDCSVQFLVPTGSTTFEARPVGPEVNLYWLVSDNQDIDHFTIGHSTDGEHFELLAERMAEVDINWELYDMTDEWPADGVNYYRLTIFRKSGEIEVLPDRVIFFNKPPAYGLVPNPATDEAFFNIEHSRKQSITITIYNTMGQAVFQKGIGEVTKAIERIDLTDFEDGLYIVSVKKGNDIYSSKLVVRK